MRINTNVAALNSQRILGNTTSAVGKNIAKLSSGFRINKAADDAAGLGIANKMRADVRSLRAASRNAEQATSVLQIAEGATTTIQGMLERMKELATQAASANTDASGRERVHAEFDELRSEITRIVDTTKFMDQKLLDGTFGSSQSLVVGASALQVGGAAGVSAISLTNAAEAGTYTLTADHTNDTVTLTATIGGETFAQTLGSVTNGAVASSTQNFDKLGVSLTFGAGAGDLADGGAGVSLVLDPPAAGNSGKFLVSSSGDYAGQDMVAVSAIDLSVRNTGTSDAVALGGLSLTSTSGATDALTQIDNSIAWVSKQLGSIGAAQNRIEYATANVKTAIENVTAAESTIRDADMAAEMTEFSKNQILQQAGVSMLAQANSSSQMVLKLLG